MLLEPGSLARDLTTRKSRVLKTKIDAKDVYIYKLYVNDGA